MAAILTAMAHLLATEGFSVSQMRSKRGALGPLAYSFYDHNGDTPAEELFRARTCVRNLLTQRAIQSFMFLLISCRDPHTVQWLQSTLQAENLEHFHGTGAFNMTRFPDWDSVLLELLSKPKEIVVATRMTRRAGGGTGWRGQIGGFNSAGQPQQPQRKTRQNPYLQETFVTYEIDIDPASLVSRIVSVREQIALECSSDFDTMVYANDQILNSYFETQENSRMQETAEVSDKTDNDSEDVEDNMRASLIIPYSDSRWRQSREQHKNAFDRYNAMLMLSNSMESDDGIKSSPLRKGTFDLMLLLSTQESIHRVLRDYAQAGDEREVSFTWLRDFYLERVQDYFDGCQQYGRADDFLEQLLLTPPMLKTWNNGRSRKDVVGLVDPLRMAEDIIRKRSEVGWEWKEIVCNVPRDHMKLRKALLTRQMGDQKIDVSDTTIPHSTREINEGFE